MSSSKEIWDKLLHELERTLYGPAFADYWKSRKSKKRGGKMTDEVKGTGEELFPHPGGNGEEKQGNKGNGEDKIPTTTEKAAAAKEEVRKTEEEAGKDKTGEALLAKVNESMAGRPESEIPLTDDYWKHVEAHRQHTNSLKG